MAVTISFNIPLASYVLPDPAIPIRREACLIYMFLVIKSDVAIVYVVGTVILLIYSPLEGSKSIVFNLADHSTNLH